MNQPKRLFDCIEVQAKAPVADLLNGKVNGEWVHYSTQQVHEKVYQLAASLLAMGVSRGDGSVEGRDKIGLISAGRPEWTIIDLAVQLTGAVLVPLYPNTNAKEIELILNEAGVKYLFVSTPELFANVSTVLPNVPSVKTVYTFDAVDNAANWATLFKSFDEKVRGQITLICNGIDDSEVATIIYTSGTTGRPKGVMLTHRNIVTNVSSSGDVLTQIPIAERRALSFLPMNHIFEKMCTYIYLFFGFSIYYAENMDTIGPNLREAKPYIFTAVPRLLEKVFERIMIEGQKLTGIKKRIFDWAITVAEQFEINGQSLWYKTQLAIADKLVFSKWRNAVGGNVKAIVVGSSATPIRLEKIFTAAGMVILEGYGLTETSPVVAVNHYSATKRRFGTVGPLLEGVHVQIDADGEILCKGPNIMAGYYKNPELTAEVVTDGWFHTGDIGSLDADGFLRITDRKKEIFKTSGGKYVAPLPIENRMKESPYIEQMMVIGADRKFTAALIVPSYTNLKAWCIQNKLDVASNEQLLRDQRVIALFQSVIDGYNPEFNHVEQVKKIQLLPAEWSIDSGELTPTGKMKRKVIMEKYKNEIAQLYSTENKPNPALI